jgi:hypothetical protein
MKAFRIADTKMPEGRTAVSVIGGCFPVRDETGKTFPVFSWLCGGAIAFEKLFSSQ